MNTNAPCDQDHVRLVKRLETLPISQAVVRGRHTCPGCAYELGFKDGIETILKLQRNMAYAGLRKKINPKV